jgi:hypothetical protein
MCGSSKSCLGNTSAFLPTLAITLCNKNDKVDTRRQVCGLL